MLKTAYKVNNCANVLHTEKLVTNVQDVSLQQNMLHNKQCMTTGLFSVFIGA